MGLKIHTNHKFPAQNLSNCSKKGLSNPPSEKERIKKTEFEPFPEVL
jgi:hypothetical protein